MLASLFLLANLSFTAGVFFTSFNVSKYLLLAIIIFLKPRNFKTIFIFIIFFFLGIWRYEFYQTKQPKITFINQKIVLIGRVSEEVDPGANYQKIILETTKINNEENNLLVLLSLPKYPEYQYGDFLEVTGKLERPENWSEFRYDRYLARYNIYATMSWPEISFIKKSRDIYSYLLDLKAKIYLLINQSLPEPAAGLANALLLGYKNTLDKEDKNTFSCLGLSHVIAISGSHLTLLSLIAVNFLTIFGFSKFQSFKPVVIFIWLYTVLTGVQTSALRSAIMISLVLWGQKNGRSNSGGRILFITAATMLFFNPLLLRDDLGFQLSFLAMLALIYFQPLGEKIFGQGSVKSSLILTINSQLLTWPITAYNFGVFSLIAPLANLLIVWLFAWLLPALLLAVILSLLFPLGKVFFFSPSYFMLDYVFKVSNYLATWSRACFNWQISGQFVFVYYLILFLIYLFFKKRFIK
jgi:competence protein ComEC